MLILTRPMLARSVVLNKIQSDLSDIISVGSIETVDDLIKFLDFKKYEAIIGLDMEDRMYYIIREVFTNGKSFNQVSEKIFISVPQINRYLRKFVTMLEAFIKDYTATSIVPVVMANIVESRGRGHLLGKMLIMAVYRSVEEYKHMSLPNGTNRIVDLYSKAYDVAFSAQVIGVYNKESYIFIKYLEDENLFQVTVLNNLTKYMVSFKELQDIVVLIRIMKEIIESIEGPDISNGTTTLPLKEVE